MSSLRASNGMVLILPIELLANGVFMGETNVGEVISVGKTQVDVKVGDTVIYDKENANPVYWNGQSFLLIYDIRVLAVVEDE
tara:strand:- start:4110 stop:4355 length:246 start_codon:yes stop_codon:yes gene_type:complete